MALEQLVPTVPVQFRLYCRPLDTSKMFIRRNAGSPWICLVRMRFPDPQEVEQLSQSLCQWAESTGRLQGSCGASYDLSASNRPVCNLQGTVPQDWQETQATTATTAVFLSTTLHGMAEEVLFCKGEQDIFGSKKRKKRKKQGERRKIQCESKGNRENHGKIWKV